MRITLINKSNFLNHYRILNFANVFSDFSSMFLRMRLMRNRSQKLSVYQCVFFIKRFQYCHHYIGTIIFLQSKNFSIYFFNICVDYMQIFEQNFSFRVRFVTFHRCVSETCLIVQQREDRCRRLYVPSNNSRWCSCSSSTTTALANQDDRDREFFFVKTSQLIRVTRFIFFGSFILSSSIIHVGSILFRTFRGVTRYKN